MPRNWIRRSAIYSFSAIREAAVFSGRTTTIPLALESMLDSRAQADALKVTGLNEDHVSILCSRKCFGTSRRCLPPRRNTSDKTYALLQGIRAGGACLRSARHENSRRCRWCWRRPEPIKRKAAQNRSASIPGRRLAIVPGRYDVSLCAWGSGRTDHQALEVKAGQITEAKFTLSRNDLANLIYAKTALMTASGDFTGNCREKRKSAPFG